MRNCIGGRWAMILPFLTLCLLLTGAVSPPPVLQSKGLYVNDYAGKLTTADRRDIQALSELLYEQTDCQVVVLTVDDLGGRGMEKYANEILAGWRVGGADNATGVLLLAYFHKESGEVQVLLAGGVPGINPKWRQPVTTWSGSASGTVMEVYRPLMRQLFEASGVEPDAAAAKMLDNNNRSAVFSGGMVVFLAAMVLVVARGYRTSRKYRSKYLKGHVRKIRSHTRSYNEEDEYKNEKIYRIDHDGMD